jgi:hypothetical protein
MNAVQNLARQKLNGLYEETGFASSIAGKSIKGGMREWIDRLGRLRSFPMTMTI